MGELHRLSVSVRCPCGRSNEAILPAAECGAEWVWLVRCRGCGSWGWFHAREEKTFQQAIEATRRRRGEPEGLSEVGRREASEVFAQALDRCPCGGFYSVVGRIEDEPCLSCGRPIGEGRWPDAMDKAQRIVPRVRATGELQR